MVFIPVQIAFAHMGPAGYPLGGSDALIQPLKARYDFLGGHFHTDSKVEKKEIY